MRQNEQFPPPLRGLYLISPVPENGAAFNNAQLNSAALNDSELRQLSETAWLKKCDAALAGGAAVLQYRDKSEDAEIKKRRAWQLKELCRKHGALFIINDSPALAAETCADGVHLGAKDESIANARRIAGPKIIIGISCGKSITRMHAAAAAGADYCAFGAVFLSPTKPEAARCPLTIITAAKKECNLPLAAIGGINPQNAKKAFAAGADMAASCAGIFNAKNITQAARQIIAAQII